MFCFNRTVFDYADSSYIGLPGSVRASVRMRNLNTESQTLTAYITLSHLYYTS